MIKPTTPVTYAWKEYLPLIGPTFTRNNPPSDISLDHCIPGLQLYANSDGVVTKEEAKNYIFAEGLIKDPTSITQEELGKIQYPRITILSRAEQFSKLIPEYDWHSDGEYIYPKNVALTAENFTRALEDFQLDYDKQQALNVKQRREGLLGKVTT